MLFSKKIKSVVAAHVVKVSLKCIFHATKLGTSTKIQCGSYDRTYIVTMCHSMDVMPILVVPSR